MRVSLAPAFILHRRPYGETSYLLDVLTEDHGRISLIAKGVRKSKSSHKAILQPFVPLLLSWQGKTELMTMTGAEANGAGLHLQGDCLLAAFYINEILNYLLLKQDPHPKLYTIYAHTLVELQTMPLQQRILRLFEKKLLEELGYGIWRNDFEADGFYRFYPESGFVRCADGIDTFSGKMLLDLALEKLEEEGLLKEAKRLMRVLFKPLLNGRELKSKELFI